LVNLSYFARIGGVFLYVRRMNRDFGTSNKENKELLYAAEMISREKGISFDSVVKAMEDGLAVAMKKKYGDSLLIDCRLDKKTGSITVLNKLEIVPDRAKDAKDTEDRSFNPRKQITLTDARSLIKRGKLGVEGEIAVGNFTILELSHSDLSRSVVQAASNEVIRKIAEAEREKEYNEFIERVGTIVSGTVKKIGIRNIVIDVDGYETLLGIDGMIPGERFNVGDKIRAYIDEVLKDQKGLQVRLSRTSSMFMAELFKQEVPEIYDGIIDITGIARDPGSKAKISIFSRNDSSDVVGAVVGARGVRVQSVTSELRGEKIDVIMWSDDIVKYITAAITPAKPIRVIYHERDNSADIVLQKEQLSLAIGRGGQNVRLASKLTGVRLNIMTEEEEKEKRVTMFKKSVEELIEALDVEEVIAQLLVTEGFDSVESIAESDPQILKNIQGFDEHIAQELQERAEEFLSSSGGEEEEFEEGFEEEGNDEN